MGIAIQSSDFTDANGSAAYATGSRGDNTIGEEVFVNLIPDGGISELIKTFSEMLGNEGARFGFDELNPVIDAKESEHHYHALSLQPGGGLD